MNEPINWQVVAQVLVPIVTGVLGVWGYHISKKAQKGDRENKIIDQLQETIAERDTFWQGQIAEVKATANDAKETAGRAEAKANKSERRERILQDYAAALRQQVERGDPPPPIAWPLELND